MYNEKQKNKSAIGLGNKALQSCVYKNWSFFGGTAGRGSDRGGGNQNQGGSYSIQKLGRGVSGLDLQCQQEDIDCSASNVQQL